MKSRLRTQEQTSDERSRETRTKWAREKSAIVWHWDTEQVSLSGCIKRGKVWEWVRKVGVRRINRNDNLSKGQFHFCAGKLAKKIDQFAIQNKCKLIKSVNKTDSPMIARTNEYFDQRKSYSSPLSSMYSHSHKYREDNWHEFWFICEFLEGNGDELFLFKPDQTYPMKNLINL